MIALSHSICSLFAMLTRGAAPDSYLQLSARAGNRAGLNSLVLPLTALGTFIPAGVLNILETDARAPWSISLAAHRAGPVSKLCTVAAVWSFTRGYFNAQHPERLSGRRWWWPDDEIAEAVARARAFLEPSVLIDARCKLIALWALTTPIDVDRNDTRAMDLLRRLAAAVSSVVPLEDAHVESLEIPLPGTGIPQHPQDPAVTQCVVLDTDRLYSIAAIEAAIAATESAAAPRRARVKEKSK